MLWAGSIVGGSVPLPHKAWANRVLGKSSFRQNQARLENKRPWQLLRAHRPGHDSPSAVLSGPTQDKSSSTCGSNLELSLEKELTSKVWVLCGHKGCGFLRAWYLLKGQVGYPFGSRQVLEKGEAGLEALSWEARGFFSFDSSNKAASWVFYLTSHLGLLHSVRALFAVLSASPLQIRAVQVQSSASPTAAVTPFPSSCQSHPASPAQSSSSMLLSCHQGKGKHIPISCFPLPSVNQPTVNISFLFSPYSHFLFKQGLVYFLIGKPFLALRQHELLPVFSHCEGTWLRELCSCRRDLPTQPF